MALFKECEKETKTKAFSKEGLAQADKMSPEEVFDGGMKLRRVQEKRYNVDQFLKKMISELSTQKEAVDADIASEKSKGKRCNMTVIEDLEEKRSQHNFHIDNLELLLRLVDNNQINPDEVESLKTFIVDYVGMLV